MFYSARLKLTAWYLAIAMAVSALFSIAIYHVLTREIERFERTNRFRIEHRLDASWRMMTPLPMSRELIEETRHRILFLLALINAGIFVSAGGLGYILAGRTLGPIQHMVEEQKRFVSDASHELRTPLTSLKSAFEVHLREKRPSERETKTLIRESLGEVDKLQSLSDSLLTLAHYSQSNGMPPKQNISLTDIAREAMRDVSPMAKKKHIAVDGSVSDCRVVGIRDSLVQLLVILLDNAIKYSPAHTAVTVTIQKKDGWACVIVADEGHGIGKKDLPHIFDRFYRADSARTKAGADGYGLGLAIAKKIVEAHQGTIRAVSQAGEGSTFTVRLPLQLAFR